MYTEFGKDLMVEIVLFISRNMGAVENADIFMLKRRGIRNS